MKEIVNEILSEWELRLPEIKRELKIYNEQVRVLKEVVRKQDFVTLSKYFIDDVKRKKGNEDIIKLTDRQQNLFKEKCSSLTALSLLKEKNLQLEKPIFMKEALRKEEPADPFVKEEVKEAVKVEQKEPEEKPKKKIKNLLDNLKLKSRKKEENKENLADQTIIIENGEIKIFKNKEKKRLKEYLKEGAIKKEEIKKTTQDLVYDVGTNRFVDPQVNNKPKPVLKSWNKSPSIKDGLYKRAIDKERSKYKVLMNTYKPQLELQDASSDEEVDNFTTNPDINTILINQNHDEIARYFGCEQSIDIELLFPNIKDLSNDSPNKWI